ncbi:MAG TPA: SAM-dependent chlorinase/fluorinase [Longimicrobiales bacterium]|nr:SAM-dependent chlorinase/fluorinase [Longimicrobiales bacterium]
MNRVTLLTDFGTRDGYVAAVKGVLASMAPGVIIDDAGHDVPPGDVEAAAWALAAYWQLYPPETVHLVIIDPGVGGARRPLAARVRDRYFVAPDNGVLTRVLADTTGARIVEIRNRAAMRSTVSHTFHGRDIFAGAAAWLARGDALDDLGPSATEPHRFTLPVPRIGHDAVEGEVVHVDRYGNLITNISEAWALGATEITLGEWQVGAVRRTYADVAPGAPVALIGSVGLLEIAVRDGCAAEVLGAGRGTPVCVHRRLPE